MKFRMFALAALAAVVLGGMATAADGPDIGKLIEKLPEYAAYEHFNAALDQLEDVRSAHVATIDRKSRFELLFGLTQLQGSMLQAGRTEDALTVTRKARELFPAEMFVGLNLGGMLATNGEYEQAIPVLRRALKQEQNLRPVERLDKVAAYINLGKSLLLTDQPEDAKRELFKAVALGKESAGAMYLLGQAFVLLEQDQNALRNYEQAFKKSPEEAEAHDLVNLADLLYDEGKYERASEVCRYGIERFPTEAGLRFYLAKCLLQDDKRLEAYHLLQLERIAGGDESKYAAATARTLYDMSEQAREKRKDPQNRQIIICILGMINSKPGKYHKAEKFFKMGIEESKEPVALLHLLLGETYAEQKKYTDAVREFEKATSIDPHLAPAYVELGDVLVKDGRPRAAVKAWRKAVLLDPKNWKVRSLLKKARKKTAEPGKDEAKPDTG